MPTLRWETTTAADFDALIHLIPAATLNSPRRSVLPLIDFFRSPAEALEKLGDALGLALVDATELAFEHAVPVQKGRGKASYTDLMIRCPSVSVAVEAKYTEPRYEVVADWLRDSENRREVLDGWLSLINQTCRTAIGRETILGLPYQLIHRAASACFMPTRKPALAYVIFGDSTKTEYVQDLAAFDDLIGRSPELSVSVLGIPLKGTEAQRKLVGRWEAREREFAVDVRAELLRGPLFSFGPIELAYHRR